MYKYICKSIFLSFKLLLITLCLIISSNYIYPQNFSHTENISSLIILSDSSNNLIKNSNKNDSIFQKSNLKDSLYRDYLKKNPEKVDSTKQNSFNQNSKSESEDSNNKKFTMKKSPLGAIIRSFILPGLGQIYVGSYWKAPLAFGGAAVLGYFIYDFNKNFNSTQKEISALISKNPEDPIIQYKKSYREYYRDNRDICIFVLAGVYLISAVDAYVDAHLFDFDVSDKFSLKIIPEYKHNVWATCLQINYILK